MFLRRRSKKKQVSGFQGYFQRNSTAYDPYGNLVPASTPRTLDIGLQGGALQYGYSVPNLLTANQSSPKDMTGWGTIDSATITVDGTVKLNGNNSMKVDTTAKIGSAPGVVVTSLTLTSGVAYTQSVYVKGTAGDVVQVVYRSVSASIMVSTANITLTGGWDRLTYTYTPTATASDFILRVIAPNANNPSGAIFWVTQWQIEPGSMATDWIAGGAVRYEKSTVNLLSYNASCFETDLSGWTINNFSNKFTVTRTSSDTYSGAGALYAVSTVSNPSDTAITMSTPSLIAIKPSTSYCFSWHIKNSVALTSIGGAGHKTAIQFYDSSGTFISEQTVTKLSSATGTWNRNFVAGTSPANAVSAKLLIGFDWPDIYASDYFLLDALQFEEGTYPTAWVPGGLDSVTNLLANSEDFTTGWTLSRVTVNSNVTMAPDGTTTADKVVEDSQNGVHYPKKDLTVADNKVITASIYAKVAERTIFAISVVRADISQAIVEFDLANKVATAVAGNPDFYTMKDVGNGWYRCSVTANVLSGGNTKAVQYRLLKTSGVANHTYPGDVGYGMYLWGAQVEEKSYLSPYTKEGTTSYYNGNIRDMLDGKALLVEEGTSNFIANGGFEQGAWSETYSPVNGTVTEVTGYNSSKAVRLTMTGSSGWGSVSTRNMTLNNGEALTISFHARADSDGRQLSYNYVMNSVTGNIMLPTVAGITTQWKRYSLVIPTFSGTSSGVYGLMLGILQNGANTAGTWVEIDNVMLEKKSYPTTYIDSTRTADSIASDLPMPLSPYFTIIGAFVPNWSSADTMTDYYKRPFFIRAKGDSTNAFDIEWSRSTQKYAFGKRINTAGWIASVSSSTALSFTPNKIILFVVSQTPNGMYFGLLLNGSNIQSIYATGSPAKDVVTKQLTELYLDGGATLTPLDGYVLPPKILYNTSTSTDAQALALMQGMAKELLVNGDFKQGKYAWIGQGATPDSTWAVGNDELTLNATIAWQGVLSDFIQVIPGNTYTFSAESMGNGTYYATVSLRGYDSNKNQLSSQVDIAGSYPVSQKTTSYLGGTVNITIPNEVCFVRVKCQTDGAGTTKFRNISLKLKI